MGSRMHGSPAEQTVPCYLMRFKDFRAPPRTTLIGSAEFVYLRGAKKLPVNWRGSFGRDAIGAAGGGVFNLKQTQRRENRALEVNRIGKAFLIDAVNEKSSRRPSVAAGTAFNREYTIERSRIVGPPFDD